MKLRSRRALHLPPGVHFQSPRWWISRVTPVSQPGMELSSVLCFPCFYTPLSVDQYGTINVLLAFREVGSVWSKCRVVFSVLDIQLPNPRLLHLSQG